MAQLSFLTLPSIDAGLRPKKGWHFAGTTWHKPCPPMWAKCQSAKVCATRKRAATRVPVAKCQSAKSDTGEYPSKT